MSNFHKRITKRKHMGFDTFSRLKALIKRGICLMFRDSSDSEFFSSDCNCMTSHLVVLVLVETCGGGRPHWWLGSVSPGAKVFGHVLVGKL